jgi:hypothetical protein
MSGGKASGKTSGKASGKERRDTAAKDSLLQMQALNTHREATRSSF